jgi:hypothetical protein
MLMRNMSQKIEVGQKYFELTVVSLLPERSKSGKKQWECLCDCGNKTIISSDRLNSGIVKTCGCLRSRTHKKHGMALTPIYKRWASIKDRCYNPNNRHYRSYGGRGIEVCEEWVNSFDEFYRWVLSVGWDGECDLSIDRIDNNKGYCPDNCRLATKKEQQRNMRSNKSLTAFGETKTVAAWAEDSRCVVGLPTLRGRINAGIMSPEDALTQKANNSIRFDTEILIAFGETKTVSQWVKDDRCAVGLKTLRTRIFQRNWDVEKALTQPSASDSFLKLEAFGETKTVAAWAEDSRCAVSKRVFEKRIYALGWTPELAIATPPLKKQNDNS